MDCTSEILSIVPLQRAKNTSVETLSNQCRATSSGPRPQAYNIGSAANIRGHWHHLKVNRKEDRVNFFQLNFSRPLFY